MAACVDCDSRSYHFHFTPQQRGVETAGWAVKPWEHLMHRDQVVWAQRAANQLSVSVRLIGCWEDMHPEICCFHSSTETEEHSGSLPGLTGKWFHGCWTVYFFFLLYKVTHVCCLPNHASKNIFRKTDSRLFVDTVNCDFLVNLFCRSAD